MMFKAIIACTPSASAAQGVGMGIVSLSFCFSGFLVTRASIPDYFIWIYWMFPYSWIIRLLAVNEYNSPGPDNRYDTMIGPLGEQKRLGTVYLEAFAMQPEAFWVGYGFIYICGVFVILFLLYTYGMHNLRLGNVRPIISKKGTKRTVFKAVSASRRCVHVYVCVCICVMCLCVRVCVKWTVFKAVSASRRYFYVYMCMCVCMCM